MEAHFYSEMPPGDWSRFTTGYGPGADFRGRKLGPDEYALEHLSGVVFGGTREELTTLLNDGLHHLEILALGADHSQTFDPPCRHLFGHRIDDKGVVCGDCGTVLEPAPPAMPESIRADAARVIADRNLGLAIPKPLDPADCPHTAPLMVHGYYGYCSACGIRMGVAQ